LTGVLFLLNKNEEAKLNADWERTRQQTWHLINIQLDRKSKINYDQFRAFYWPFVWERNEAAEIPEIDWEEKDRRDRERQALTYKTEIIEL
jgi:hypothetical protein